jgi:ABC-type transporter Mla subunit MlaD
MILIVDREDVAKIVELSALLRANLGQGAQIMQQLADLKKAQADVVAAITAAAAAMQSAASKLGGISQQDVIDPAEVEAVAQALEQGAANLNNATAGLQAAVAAQPSTAAPGTPAELIPVVTAPAPAPIDVAPAPTSGPAPGETGVIGG